MKLVIHFKENEWKTTCLKLLVWQARLSKTFAKIQYLMSAAFGEAIQCSIWPDQTDKLANIGANPTPSKKKMVRPIKAGKHWGMSTTLDDFFLFRLAETEKHALEQIKYLWKKEISKLITNIWQIQHLWKWKWSSMSIFVVFVARYTDPRWTSFESIAFESLYRNKLNVVITAN